MISLAQRRKTKAYQGLSCPTGAVTLFDSSITPYLVISNSGLLGKWVLLLSCGLFNRTRVRGISLGITNMIVEFVFITCFQSTSLT
jgi:hypothetical protein